MLHLSSAPGVEYAQGEGEDEKDQQNTGRYDLHIDNPLQNNLTLPISCPSAQPAITFWFTLGLLRIYLYGTYA